NCITLKIPYGDTDDALTPSVKDVTGTPLTAGWDCGKRTTSSVVAFVFWPLSGTKFPIGAQAQMTLPLEISTLASGPATIKVTKTYPPLAVLGFSAEPVYVGAQQRVNLTWQVTGASQVQVTPNVGTFS